MARCVPVADGGPERRGERVRLREARHLRRRRAGVGHVLVGRLRNILKQCWLRLGLVTMLGCSA